MTKVAVPLAASMGQAGAMAITLPLPFRVAAGILGTGIDLVRSLPDDIPAIPVTLVGNAMKLSIKVQQEIATLATRGDELLGGVIGGAEEHPAWATFDDDEPVRPVRPVSKLKTAKETSRARDPEGEATSEPVAPPRPGPYGSKTEPGKAVAAATKAAADPGQAAGDTTLTTPEASAMPPVVTTAMEAAIEVGDAVIEEALVAVDESPVPGVAALDAAVDQEVTAEVTEALEEAVALEVAAEVAEALEEAVALEVAAEVTEALEDAAAQELEAEVTEALAEALSAENGPVDAVEIDAEDFTEHPVVFEETAELTEALPVPPELLEEVVEATESEPSDGPEPLPDYDQMTLAQVRGHLRELSSGEVSALLRYEQDGDARPPFLTLLSNRLVTLDAQNQ
jgi:hypothetical protein